MQVSRSSRATSVFVLKWEDVNRLYSRLADEFPVIKISVFCTDGLTRKFSNLDDLKQFGNAKRVAIESLRFDCSDESYRNRCSISFESRSTDNVRFSVDAEEVAGTGLNTFYIDFLDSNRPWYSKLAVIDFALALTAVGLVSVVGLLLFAWVKGILKAAAEATSNANNAENAVFSLAAGVLIMVIATSLNYYKAKFFPMGSFALGDGLKRHDSMEVVRTVVILSFIVSIAASIFYSFFSR